MSSPKTIADIKLNLLRPELTSHFAVTIPKPGGGFDGFLASNGITLTSLNRGKLNLLCSEAVLPGSNLATFEINDNFHGVTERHAYRRVYDDRIDLTFYVNADNYMPIRYFEIWMKYISGESVSAGGGMLSSKNSNYFYRVNYPDKYMATGLQVIKFERTGDTKNERYISKPLIYEFINSYPISVASMPVSYDSSSLLKCSVSLSYIRYLMMPTGTDPAPTATTSSIFTGDPSSPNFTATPQELAQINSSFNSNIDLSSITGNITPGGVPFDSAGASQASTFTPF